MSFISKATYFYIKNIKRWMECPVCHNKMLFDKETDNWSCDTCNYILSEKDFLDDFIFWFIKRYSRIKKWKFHFFLFEIYYKIKKES